MMDTIPVKGPYFHRDLTFQSLRWYLACSLSCRDIEEMMPERGFSADHFAINY